MLLGFLAAVVDAQTFTSTSVEPVFLSSAQSQRLLSGSFRIAGIDLVDDYGWFGSRVLFGSGLLLVRSRSGHADQGDAAQCHRSGEQRD